MCKTSNLKEKWVRNRKRQFTGKKSFSLNKNWDVNQINCEIWFFTYQCHKKLCQPSIDKQGETSTCQKCVLLKANNLTFGFTLTPRSFLCYTRPWTNYQKIHLQECFHILHKFNDDHKKPRGAYQRVGIWEFSRTNHFFLEWAKTLGLGSQTKEYRTAYEGTKHYDTNFYGSIFYVLLDLLPQLDPHKFVSTNIFFIV